MPSLKSHIVALVVRNWHRSAFTSPEGLHRWIRWARQRENHRPPRSLDGRLDIAATTAAGFPVYEVRPRRVESRLRLLYLHGGAYVFQISSYHWNLIAELAERLGATVTVPIYPIAPEHGFHEMFGMVMEVYRAMLRETAASDIAMVGDSAGGNMAVVLTMMAAQSGLPSPGRHVLISPGLDMSLSNPEVFEAAKLDPWLAIPGGLEAVRLYAEGFDRRDWRISPLYGDLAVLPKTLLLTGTRDILHPDTLVFAERARAANVDVELFVEPGMLHVWPLMAIREARPARDRIVAFLKEIESGNRAASPAASSRETSELQPAASDLLAARSAWPLGSALTSLMSRFGSSW
jgi:acetyl esterase/lipase